MYGYIYKTTNTLTNKIYVGQKKSTYFLHEKYFGSGQIIKSIIKKYGKTNLTVEMIDTAESKEELDEKEIHWISTYSSTNPIIGYNIALGGSGATVEHQTEATKQKISIANAGKVRRDSVKDAMSAKRKYGAWVNDGCTQKHVLKEELNTYLSMGWKRGMCSKKSSGNKSAETRLKMSSAQKGKKLTEEHVENHRNALITAHRHWYTNGTDEMCIAENENVPYGYRPGRIVTDESKLKNSLSCKGRIPWNKGISKNII